MQRVKAAHSRVIWSLSWSPDDRLLATGARDESVKIWSRSDLPVDAGAASFGPNAATAAVFLQEPAATLPPFGSVVCALSFAPSARGDGGRYLLAVGLEGGDLMILAVDATAAAGPRPSEELWRSDRFTRHAASVASVCWRTADDAPGRLHLASCGHDHAVRVFRVVRSV